VSAPDFAERRAWALIAGLALCSVFPGLLSLGSLLAGVAAAAWVLLHAAAWLLELPFAAADAMSDGVEDLWEWLGLNRQQPWTEHAEDLRRRSPHGFLAFERRRRDRLQWDLKCFREDLAAGRSRNRRLFRRMEKRLAACEAEIRRLDGFARALPRGRREPRQAGRQRGTPTSSFGSAPLRIVCTRVADQDRQRDSGASDQEETPPGVGSGRRAEEGASAAWG